MHHRHRHHLCLTCRAAEDPGILGLLLLVLLVGGALAAGGFAALGKLLVELIPVVAGFGLMVGAALIGRRAELRRRESRRR